MDPLAGVLTVAGVRGTVAATLGAGEPWGLLMAPAPGAAFHAVIAGTAWLATAEQPGIRLMPGDVVLLPSGVSHTLASGPGADAEPFDHQAADRALAAGEPMLLGGGPAQTRILCAAYHQDPAVTQPLLSLLPDVLHIPAGQASHGLEAALRLLATEARQRQPGAAAVLDKILDILLVQVLRWWLATSPAGQPPACWLSALTDPVAGPVLAAMHGEPGHGWTIATLAGQTGISRATLARRFRDRVGLAPGAYLTSWRMDLAARRLRDTDESVGSIARSLGYTSEYAFNRAFARARGLPPGRYRTASRLPGSAPARQAPGAERKTAGDTAVSGEVSVS